MANYYLKCKEKTRTCKRRAVTIHCRRRKSKRLKRVSMIIWRNGSLGSWSFQ